MQPVPPVSNQLDAIRRCLGLPPLDPVSPDHDDGRTAVYAVASELAEVSATGLPLPAGFLLEPRLIHSVSCKWKKDRKPCGITDVVLTDDGRVFVTDFLNRAVKIYDTIPVLL